MSADLSVFLFGLLIEGALCSQSLAQGRRLSSEQNRQPVDPSGVERNPIRHAPESTSADAAGVSRLS